MSQIEVPGHSREDIQKMAARVRTLFGISPEKSFPIVQLLEALGTPLGEDETPVLEVEIVQDEELQDNYAEYHPLSNTLLIRESVYDGACNDNGRDRFTLAHEVGHYLFHSDQAMLQRVESGMETPIYRSPEWQANTFASKILMPYDEIVGKTPEQIMKEYGVSFSAAEIAAKNAQNAKKTDLF